jgi:hypothetical protein
VHGTGGEVRGTGDGGGVSGSVVLPRSTSWMLICDIPNDWISIFGYKNGVKTVNRTSQSSIYTIVDML